MINKVSLRQHISEFLQRRFRQERSELPQTPVFRELGAPSGRVADFSAMWKDRSFREGQIEFSGIYSMNFPLPNGLPRTRK
jgi:hypothetical protein